MFPARIPAQMARRRQQAPGAPPQGLHSPRWQGPHPLGALMGPGPDSPSRTASRPTGTWRSSLAAFSELLVFMPFLLLFLPKKKNSAREAFIST